MTGIVGRERNKAFSVAEGVACCSNYGSGAILVRRFDGVFVLDFLFWRYHQGYFSFYTWHPIYEYNENPNFSTLYLASR